MKAIPGDPLKRCMPINMLLATQESEKNDVKQSQPGETCALKFMNFIGERPNVL